LAVSSGAGYFLTFFDFLLFFLESSNYAIESKESELALSSSIKCLWLWCLSSSYVSFYF